MSCNSDHIKELLVFRLVVIMMVVIPVFILLVPFVVWKWGMGWYGKRGEEMLVVSDLLR